MAVAEDLGVDVDVLLYMKEPPDASVLRRIAEGLDGPVEDLVRKDSTFKKLELDESDYVGDIDAVVDLLSERKALIQRPVVVKGDLSGSGALTAVVGRPKEAVTDFLS